MHDQDNGARGDRTGLPLPIDGEALRAGGPEWLTRAFRTFGTLSPGNRVTDIVQCQGFEGGGTGTKALLSVSYACAEPNLDTELFVKFSRNLSDLAMDAAKFHMEPEVRFAALSRMPDFPIEVAPCAFADYHHESGTGLLITSRIPFGQNGIEPQYSKCLDHEMPDPLEHYRALVRTLGQLAGSFKGGKLPESVSAEFSWDLEKALAADRLPYAAEQLQRRVARYATFAQNYPGLLPAAIRSPDFIAALGEGAVLFRQHEGTIKQVLHDRPEFIALCHWNANADNAWFWRDAHGELQCGMLDWGSVGQIHVAMSLWGCLSGAEQWIWRDHIDSLLELFATEYHRAGGPELDPVALKLHLLLYTAMMGLCWLMDAPPRIEREVPDLTDCLTRLDPRITVSETARVQLQMMTNFLAFWQAEDLTGQLRELFEEHEPALELNLSAETTS